MSDKKTVEAVKDAVRRMGVQETARRLGIDEFSTLGIANGLIAKPKVYARCRVNLHLLVGGVQP